MPGRKKCFVATLFNEAPVEPGGSKVKQVTCKFCCLKLSKNGTLMTEHIAKFMKCSDQIKNKYLNDIRLKQKKVQTELLMEEDIPENLPVQNMETGGKKCLATACKLQLSHSFTLQAVVEAEVGLQPQNLETINRVRISQRGLP